MEFDLHFIAVDTSRIDVCDLYIVVVDKCFCKLRLPQPPF